MVAGDPRPAIRQRTDTVRFSIYDADYEASVAVARNALGDRDFQSGWAEGAALSTDEAISYAQRGRGERKRPASGVRQARRPALIAAADELDRLT